MPWNTPVLREVRTLVRDHIRGSLPGADANVPNSVLRVLSDVQAATCHLTLQYLDWLALQLMPDTAEEIWLDRHADIWLVNSDGTTGRKMATLATGVVNFIEGTPGVLIPIATQLTAGVGIGFETTEEAFLSSAPTPVAVRALDPGSAGNLPVDTSMTVDNAPPGVSLTATVVSMGGGADEENDDDLRTRVLERIRQPPQGGAIHDFIAWAKDVPGVTRAWAIQDMGIGTVTVRFMMDELRAVDHQGFPTGFDIETVKAYIDTVRPVAVKDYFVVSPVPYRIDVYIQNLIPDTSAIRANVEAALQTMLLRSGEPGQTIFAAWKYHAIMEAPGVESFDLRISTDDVMPSSGHLPVLGDIVYGITV